MTYFENVKRKDPKQDKFNNWRTGIAMAVVTVALMGVLYLYNKNEQDKVRVLHNYSKLEEVVAQKNEPGQFREGYQKIAERYYSKINLKDNRISLVELGDYISELNENKMVGVGDRVKIPVYSDKKDK